MAQRIQMLFIDDIDGGEAAGTVRFGLDGTQYEIDLSAAHGDELRKALEQYIAHARRTGGTARRAARSRRGSGAVDTAKVREWAKGQGIEIKDRGRVPASVVEQYKTAVGAQTLYAVSCRIAARLVEVTLHDRRSASRCPGRPRQPAHTDTSRLCVADDTTVL